jgi:hypothetical protein
MSPVSIPDYECSKSFLAPQESRPIIDLSVADSPTEAPKNFSTLHAKNMEHFVFQEITREEPPLPLHDRLKMSTGNVTPIPALIAKISKPNLCQKT